MLTISFCDWLLCVIMASCTLLACCWHLISCSVQVRESISKDLTSHRIQSGAVAAHGTVSQSLNTAPSNSSTQASFGFENQTCWAECDLVRGKLLGSNVPFGCRLYFVAHVSAAKRWLVARKRTHFECIWKLVLEVLSILWWLVSLA